MMAKMKNLFLVRNDWVESLPPQPPGPPPEKEFAQYWLEYPIIECCTVITEKSSSVSVFGMGERLSDDALKDALAVL